MDPDEPDLYDLTGLEEQVETPSPSAPSPFFLDSFAPSSFLGCFLKPFARPAVEEVAPSDAEPEDVALEGSSEQPETGKAARRKRKMVKNKEKRQKRRKLTQDQLGTRLKGIARTRAAESQRWDAKDTFATESLPVNSGGWSGLRQRLEKIHPQIKELLDEHEMEVVEWNGRCVSCLAFSLMVVLRDASRDSHAIVDREGRVISVLAGTPRDPNWGSLMKELEEAIGQAQEKMTFSKKQKEHVRGVFPSVSVGSSFGGGSKVR